MQQVDTPGTTSASTHALTGGAPFASTRAEIDLAALRRNVRILQRLAGDASVMAVVKADAYGHGAVRVVQELQKMGIHRFAVATLAEGIELREAGVDDAILVFGAPVPGDVPVYGGHRLGITISSDAVADSVIAAGQHGGSLEAHLKIDTGMSRIGVAAQEADAVARRLLRAPGVRLESLWTHLATADEPGSPFVQEQLERFEETIAAVRDDVPFTHVANSGALLNHRRSLELNARTMVRPGITLYGLSPSPDTDLALEAGLEPIMRVVSRVRQIKTVAAGTTVSYSRRWTAPAERVIATIGGGYADGYPRHLTNKGEVGIGGNRYAVAGTVCMDMFMVDLGPPGAASYVKAGDDVILFGAGGPSCFEVANAVGTITYEIACRVSRRVPRAYRDTAAAD